MARMTSRGELPLPGKLTVRAGHRKVVLAKRAWESERHVLLKALVFGLYVAGYPELAVERAIGERYKPDLVALEVDGQPLLWAECGETGRQKLEYLIKALPGTHLVVAKQVASIAPHRAVIETAVAKGKRSAPVELLNFPPDASRFLGEDGGITIGFADVTLVRF